MPTGGREDTRQYLVARGVHKEAVEGDRNVTCAVQ